MSTSFPAQLDVADLVGLPYEKANCYALVRLALARHGQELPEDPAALIAEAHNRFHFIHHGPYQAGDIVRFDNAATGEQHVGVLATPRMVLHTTRGSAANLVPLAALMTHHPEVRIARLRPTTGPVVVRCVQLADAVLRSVVRSDTLAMTTGATIADLIAGHLQHLTGHLLVVCNGRVIADPAATVLQTGDEVHVAPRPGDFTGTTWVLIAIALASAAASAALSMSVRAPRAQGSREPESKRFEFSRYSSDAIAGDAIAVVFGERRYGGKEVARVPGEGENGNARLRLLISMGHGPVQQIANFTGDEDGIDVADSRCSGIYLNDTPISSFPGGRVSVRMGEDVQSVIPGFADSERLREVGVGGAALENTSGSERTGGSASGEAVTYSTIDPVEALVVRVRFPQGLASISGSGRTNPRRVQYRLRRRTSDVGAGAGSWSGWTVVTVERAETNEFVSAKRVDGLTLAKYDVQVERVTVEPTSLSETDAMRFDSVVEITLTNNNYAGFAMLALDLAAGEQLTSPPRVSVEMKGYAAMRIWDGVSDGSSPTFTTGYSNNPAAVFLEYLTNERWGLGAQYPFDALSAETLDSIFDAWTYADELVPRATTGTRKRFTFNYPIDELRDGIEWLRVICRAMRAVPATVGGQWRVIVDRPRTIASEKFTDASIAVDGDGRSIFRYRRELTTGGVVRDNRLTVQFENAGVEGRNDLIAWPAYGESWLAVEPVREGSIKLEGVTDAEEALAAIKHELRRIRFLSTSIEFETTKEFVVVQPGERFDLAMSLPGWGLASGRVRSGGTTTTVSIDKDVTLPAGVNAFELIRGNGSVEVVTIISPAGSYRAGDTITVATFTAPPDEGDEYAVGGQNISTKPFTCTSIECVDPASWRWKVGGIEYADSVYDDTAEAPNLPDYSTLTGSGTPPGPVINLTATERTVDGLARVELGWGQQPRDVGNTAAFRVYRRPLGMNTWLATTLAPSRISLTLEPPDLDRAYEYTVVAVSSGGASLSPDDTQVPRVTVAVGLSALPLDPPSGLTLTQEAGAYTLAWTAVDGAVGYQVLYGGDTTSLPNVGAEECEVLARTIEPQLAGLVLPAAQSTRFFVRSVNASGRLSWTAATINLSSPATPPAQAIKDTRTLDLDSEGTLTNLTWNGTTLRLELTTPGTDGVYLTPEIDLTTLTLSTLTIKLQTANDFDDPTIGSDPFRITSIASDQWGVIDATPTVGMLMPPWPDSEQTWTVEVKTYDGVIWSDWLTLTHALAGVTRSFSKYQVRVTMRRAHAPYRPALAGLIVVVTE